MTKFCQKVSAVTIESDVAKWLRGAGDAWVRNGSAGEVEGIVAGVEHHLDDVGVGELGFVLEGGGGGDEVDAGIFGEEGGELVDESGLDEGLVALDIDEVGGIGVGGGGFGETVGAGGVLR